MTTRVSVICALSTGLCLSLSSTARADLATDPDDPAVQAIARYLLNTAPGPISGSDVVQRKLVDYGLYVDDGRFAAYQNGASYAAPVGHVAPGQLPTPAMAGATLLHPPNSDFARCLSFSTSVTTLATGACLSGVVLPLSPENSARQTSYASGLDFYFIQSDSLDGFLGQPVYDLQTPQPRVVVFPISIHTGSVADRSPQYLVYGSNDPNATAPGPTTTQWKRMELVRAYTQGWDSGWVADGWTTVWKLPDDAAVRYVKVVATAIPPSTRADVEIDAVMGRSLQRTARTDPATGVESYSAILHGRIQTDGLPASFTFELGTSPALATFFTVGELTYPISAPYQDVSAPAKLPAPGLSPNTTVYFRARFVIPGQGTFRGDILSFTTPPDTFLDTANANIAALQTGLATTSASLTTCQGGVTSCAAGLVTCNSGVASCNATSATVAQQNATLEASLASFAAELASCKSTLAQVTASIALLHDQIASVTAANEALTAINAALTTSNAGLGEQIVSLTAANASLQDQLTTTTAQLATCITSVTEARAQLVVLTTTNASLAADNASQLARIVQLSGELAAAQGQVAGLQGQVAGLEASLSQCGGDLAGTEAELALAQADLGVARADLGSTHAALDALTLQLAEANGHLLFLEGVLAAAALGQIGAGSTVGIGTFLGNGAKVGDGSTLGTFSALGARSKVGDHTTIGDDARIGDSSGIGSDAHIGTALSMGDDSNVKDGAVVGDHVTIGGGVMVGVNSRIGAGATLGDGVTVRKNAVVPPGAVIPPGTIVR